MNPRLSRLRHDALTAALVIGLTGALATPAQASTTNSTARTPLVITPDQTGSPAPARLATPEPFHSDAHFPNATAPAQAAPPVPPVPMVPMISVPAIFTPVYLVPVYTAPVHNIR